MCGSGKGLMQAHSKRCRKPLGLLHKGKKGRIIIGSMCSLKQRKVKSVIKRTCFYDYYAEGNNILNQNENHRVLLPFPDNDEELDIITSISDKKSSIEILNKQKEQPVKAQGTINKEIENLSSQQKKSDEKGVFIVGDSITKNVNGYDVSGKTEQCRVYIRPSLGAKVRCMEDHIKPVIKEITLIM